MANTSLAQPDDRDRRLQHQVLRESIDRHKDGLLSIEEREELAYRIVMLKKRLARTV